MTTIMNSERQLRSLSAKKLIDAEPKLRLAFQSTTGCKIISQGCQFKIGKATSQKVQEGRTYGNSKTNNSALLNSRSIQQNNDFVVSQSLKRTEARLTSNKVTNFRNLLPYYLKAKFPDELATICKITHKIDEYLQRISQKPARQSFINLQSFISNTENIEITETHFKKINYIAPNFYNYFKDPINNLIIENPQNQSLNLRHQAFRKTAYHIYQAKINEGSEKEQIPAKQFLAKRTQYFYAKKIFRKIQNVEKIGNRIKDEFVKEIMNQIKQKEQQLNKMKKQSAKVQASEQNIKYFKNLIYQIYESKKVSNMYKATLVQLVQQRTNESKVLVLSGLECIISQQQDLKQIFIKDMAIVNLEKEGWMKN